MSDCAKDQGGSKSYSKGTVKTEKFSYYTIKDVADNATNCDHAGTKNSTKTITSNVYFDKEKPNCDYSKSHTYKTDGVTITYTCSDPKEPDSSGVKKCPGKDTKKTSDVKHEIKDKAGKTPNSYNCKVPVYSQTQYKKRTCNKYNKCQNSACGTSTIYACVCSSGCSKCPGGYTHYSSTPSGCGTYGWNGNMSGENAYAYKACTITKSCRTAACGCASWSSYSGWSTKNHCPGKKDSNSCQQKSRVVYY